MCVVCPLVAWLGGGIVSYFVQPFTHLEGKILSGVITANLISLTTIALKAIFDISLCGGGGFTLANIVRVVGKTAPMWIIYSIGVNYLLSRYVFPPPQSNQYPDQASDDSLPNDEIAPVCYCNNK